MSRSHGQASYNFLFDEGTYLYGVQWPHLRWCPADFFLKVVPPVTVRGIALSQFESKHSHQALARKLTPKSEYYSTHVAYFVGDSDACNAALIFSSVRSFCMACRSVSSTEVSSKF